MERQTHAEFEKLYSFLRHEEAMRMQALKREEEQRSRAMAQKMEELARDMTSASQHIRALQEELAVDSISMLHVSLNYALHCANADGNVYSFFFYILFLFSEMQEDAGEVLRALLHTLSRLIPSRTYNPMNFCPSQS